MIRLIPAIDILDGKCVRLLQGSFAKELVYAGSALDFALAYLDQGYKQLHLVDLGAAKQGKLLNLALLANLCTKTKLQIDYGGGVRSRSDVRAVLDCGAKQVNLGSLAVNKPDLLLECCADFGTERIIFAADCRDGALLTDAWRSRTERSLYELLKVFEQAGLRHVCITDVSRDGTLSSPNFELYQSLRDKFPELSLIASGGISSFAQLEVLASMGISAAIIGRALLEKRICAQELQDYLC